MEYLEAGLTEDWNLYPSGGRELDPLKVEMYLNLVGGEYFEAARYILDNTRYVSYDQFKIELQKSFDMFKDNVRNEPFYLIYSTRSKIGSENWLCHLLYPQIREMNIMDVIGDDSDSLHLIPFGSNILIVDDAIYTGNNITGTIDEMSYPRGVNNGCKFHIVVPYSTESGRETMTFLSNNFSYDFYHTHTMIQSRELSKSDPVSYRQVVKFDRHIGAEGWPVPVYFDWKVANIFGSYPQIYLLGTLPHVSLSTDPRSEMYDEELLVTDPINGVSVETSTSGYDDYDPDWFEKRELLLSNVRTYEGEVVDERIGPLVKKLPTREPIDRVIKLISLVDEQNLSG